MDWLYISRCFGWFLGFSSAAGNSRTRLIPVVGINHKHANSILYSIIWNFAKRNFDFYKVLFYSSNSSLSAFFKPFSREKFNSRLENAFYQMEWVKNNSIWVTFILYFKCVDRLVTIHTDFYYLHKINVIFYNIFKH